MPIEQIERQAKLLAAENKKGDPDIERVYWFPDDDEVHLVGILPSIPESSDGLLHPFYFRPAPDSNLPAASGIALIRPNEFGRLKLPPRWGDWNAAVLIEEQE